MKDLIKRLRELEAAATPGPWEYDGISYVFQKGSGIEDQMMVEMRGYPQDENAKLIAEMRNSLSIILDRLEKLEAVIEVHKTLVTYCEDRFTWSAKPDEWEYMTDELALKQAKDTLATLEDKK